VRKQRSSCKSGHPAKAIEFVTPRVQGACMARRVQEKRVAASRESPDMQQDRICVPHRFGYVNNSKISAREPVFTARSLPGRVERIESRRARSPAVMAAKQGPPALSRRRARCFSGRCAWVRVGGRLVSAPWRHTTGVGHSPEAAGSVGEREMTALLLSLAFAAVALFAAFAFAAVAPNQA
jgi:hypothetical protein